MKVRDNKLTIVLVYVDDLIITGDGKEKINQIKSNISIYFQMKEFRKLKDFLGLEIQRTKDGLFLC